MKLNSTGFLIPKWSAPDWVKAICTTRHGVALPSKNTVSCARYASLNVAAHVGDDPMRVAKNRQHLEETWGMGKLIFLNQVHGTHVVELPQSGLPKHKKDKKNHVPIVTADACWTVANNTPCTTMAADCLPVLFCDVQGKCVAAAHAGWRGLQQGVLEKTLQKVMHEANCTAADVLVWLGPCIGTTAFQVGQDVRAAFGDNHAISISTNFTNFTHPPFFYSKDNSIQKTAAYATETEHPAKYNCDLAGIARVKLRHSGVINTHLFGNDSSLVWCTFTQKDTFFSHRRDANATTSTGRMAISIAISKSIYN